MNNPYTTRSTASLEQQATTLRAIILIDGSDLSARRTLLAINRELGERRKRDEIRTKPLSPWLSTLRS